MFFGCTTTLLQVANSFADASISLVRISGVSSSLLPSTLPDMATPSAALIPRSEASKNESVRIVRMLLSPTRDYSGSKGCLSENCKSVVKPWSQPNAEVTDGGGHEATESA